MGHVYEARDPRLLRSVALKVLHLERSQKDIVGHQRLLHEARIAAALEHPNVVAVYDVGEIERPEDADSTMYLAMELIAGRPLRAYVGDPSVPVKERVRWLRDVASALGAAHARGMVHRDVKPENVMVRDDGVVKVLDFGIAKRDPSSLDPTASAAGPIVPTTAIGVTVGTPYYMAPEQMRGESLDGRADQFAWAVMAYELLAGELPWNVGTEADALQVVAQILSQDPPLLTNKNGDLPVAVAASVMRALAKSRENRFATMAALLDAMEAEGPAPQVTTFRGPGLPPASTGPTSSTDPLHPALAATQAVFEEPAAATRPRRKAMAVVAGTLAFAAVVGVLVLAKAWSGQPAHESPAALAPSAAPPPPTAPLASTPPAPSVAAATSLSASAAAATASAQPSAGRQSRPLRPVVKPGSPASPASPSPSSSPYDHM